VRKKFKDCTVSNWQNNSGGWNCFIQAPFCNYVIIHAVSSTKEEAYKLCSSKWKDKYGKNNRKPIEIIPSLQATVDFNQSQS